MWNRRWIGLAVAWLAAIIGIACRTADPAALRGNRARLRRHAVAVAPGHGRLEHPAEPRAAGGDGQPDADHQADGGKARGEDLAEAKSQTPAEIDNLVDAVIGSLQLTAERTPPGQSSYLYAITYRDTDRAAGKGGGPVAAQDLRRIEPRQQAAGYAERAATSWTSRSSSTTRACKTAENRLKEFKLKYMGIAGQGGQAGQDFFAQDGEAQRRHRQREARAALRGAVARLVSTAHWPARRRR